MKSNYFFPKNKKFIILVEKAFENIVFKVILATLSDRFYELWKL